MNKVDWNIANILTMFRIILVPVILILILIYSPVSLIAAFILYLVSSVTDILDGHLARKYSLQSEFGAYWDPLADKILTLGLYTVLIFIPSLRIYWWLVLLLYIRDIGVTLIRNYFKSHAYKFTTSRIAKAKTIVQMIILGIILFFIMYTRIRSEQLNISGQDTITATWEAISGDASHIILLLPMVLTILVVAFTLYSSIKYLKEFLQLTGRNPS